jgi:RNA polymerase sigma-70 factor (ECF subfamily)
MELNRAVAIAETGQVDQALKLVESLDLETYPHFHSTRAELLRRLGQANESRAAYETAIALAPSKPEREFLEQRRAEACVRRKLT